MIDPNLNPYLGATITINIVPSTPPLSLSLIQPYTHLTSIPSTANIYVTGHYSNSLQLNLTSDVTGTTYSSSNPNVVTVDPEGHVKAVAFGTATVTVQNSGIKTFATFVVGNPASPLAPQDITSGIKITLSGLQFDSIKNVFLQTVQLTNASEIPIAGPLYYVTTDLPNGVMLWAPKSGMTKHISPVGSPYLRLQPADGLTLRPGESISLNLQFLNRYRADISYKPKVYTSAGMP
jgi:hypothetical protein